MSGQLRADLPAQLRLGAHYGAIGPVFALLANADSCELLFHRERLYWTSARDAPDWRRLNPSAWVRAVEWALSPASLIHSIRFDSDGAMPSAGADTTAKTDGPAGAGRGEAADDGTPNGVDPGQPAEDRLWSRSGKVAAAGLGILLRGEPGSRLLKDVSLWDGPEPLLTIRFESYFQREGGPLPRKLAIFSPRDHLRVDLEIQGWEAASAMDEPPTPLRPPGWLPVGPADAPSYLPEH
jgi:hypothetical protein